MDYKIAIPSFNRQKQLLQKTLNTLERYKIPREKIYIFVVKDEYDTYVDIIGSNYNLIIGELGIVNQRNFIGNYFEEGDHIISLDDDIEEFYELAYEADKNKLSPIKDLNSFFIESFKILQREKLYIWGIYPVCNAFFMYDIVTTDLRFIIGCCFGFIVRKDPILKMNQITETKEDYQQTILYFNKDGGVVRFNGVTIKTKFNASGGLGTDRAERNKTAAENLYAMYPNIITRFQRKNGTHEVKLKKLSRLLTTSKEPIVFLPKLDEAVFNNLIDLLKTHAVKMCDKRSSRLGFGRHRSEQYGIVKARFQGTIGLSKPSQKYPEIYNEILKIAKSFPTFKFTTIQLNNNVVCPPHHDSDNIGSSLLVSFGDYKGCNIVIEGIMYDAKYSPIIFNGSQREHWNTNDLVGNKYTLVFYNNKSFIV